jgi:hypothetical protein
MPDRKPIESISPFLVYRRFVIGLVLVAIGMFRPVHTTDDQTVQWAFLLVGGFIALWGVMAVRNPRLALKYANNPGKTVAELIEEWKPTAARLESEYEKSLHSFLKSKLTFTKVTRQYGTARVKCDIATGNDVMIELKAGFKSTQKLQRLIGQIELFNREWEDKSIIVLLLGETEEDLLHDLNRSIRDYSRVRVIVKEVNRVVESDSDEEKAKAHSA